MTVIAFIIAILLVFAVLPQFNLFADTVLSFNLMDGRVIIGLLVILIFAGLLVNLILLGWVLLSIPSQPNVILGFAPGRDPVPGLRLLLLPLISIAFFSLDLLLGLYFFRRQGYQAQLAESEGETTLVPAGIFAYLLWGSGLITALLLLAAVFFILYNG